MPIYKGTYERNTPDWMDPTKVRGRTWFIQATQDLSRTIDYLATRPDIDSERFIYAGLSFGASIAPVLLVEEPRFRAAVLISGGYQPSRFMPEIESRQYTGHVQIPVLMINGLYDSVHPVESSQMPMYRHLGSPDKQIKHFEDGHITAIDESVKFADEWLRSRTRMGRTAN